MGSGGVLIVDDDADIRDSLRLALEIEGHDVEVARHGGEAWDRLRRGEVPGLVLLDLAMPVMNGEELLARIQADDQLRSVPVVLITAFGAMADAVGGRAHACLRKPIDLEDVLAVARRYCVRPTTGSP
jgi:CheY-like chemotaxis protein